MRGAVNQGGKQVLQEASTLSEGLGARPALTDGPPPSSPPVRTWEAVALTTVVAPPLTTCALPAGMHTYTLQA